MFGRKLKAETRESSRTKGAIQAISEEAINRVCSTNEPDWTEKDTVAIEETLERNV